MKASAVGIMAVLSERFSRVQELYTKINDFPNEPGETQCLFC